MDGEVASFCQSSQPVSQLLSELAFFLSKEICEVKELFLKAVQESRVVFLVLEDVGLGGYDNSLELRMHLVAV